MQSAGFLPFEEASLSSDAKCIRRTLHRSSNSLPPSLPLFSLPASHSLQRGKDKSITQRALSRVNGNSMEKWLSDGRARAIVHSFKPLPYRTPPRFLLAWKGTLVLPFSLNHTINGVSRFPSDMTCAIITWTHSLDKGTLSASFAYLPEKEFSVLLGFDIRSSERERVRDGWWHSRSWTRIFTFHLSISWRAFYT